MLALYDVNKPPSIGNNELLLYDLKFNMGGRGDSKPDSHKKIPYVLGDKGTTVKYSICQEHTQLWIQN